MLNLNINETRMLDFEVQISGIDSEQLKGSLRFEVNNVEYGFPVEFKNESILVNIPPLKNIISTELKEGTTLKALLEVNANGFYLNPWSGEFIVSSPVKMEAKIKESKAPEINVGKVVVDEKEEINENVDNKLDKLNKLYKKENKIKTVKAKKKPKVILENVTEEQVYKFMEHMGTKTPHIQKLLYEQCRQIAKTDKPKDVLKQVYKRLKRN